MAHIEDETKQFVARCVSKMGKNFLEHVGTVNVARDLDAIRAALGDDKLTYLGYSYGTRIGSAYAEAYPQNVRAMILDGAVDPNADPIEADLRQAKGFQDAFNDYAADCAKKPTCPLGSDPTKAVDVYHSLVDPLVDPNNQMIGRPANERPARIELFRRHRGHLHGVVLADVVAPPDRRPGRAARRTRGHSACPGRHVYAARLQGPLHQRHRCTGRDQLR